MNEPSKETNLQITRVAAAFLALSWITCGARVYVRRYMISSFKCDDILMLMPLVRCQRVFILALINTYAALFYSDVWHTNDHRIGREGSRFVRD